MKNNLIVALLLTVGGAAAFADDGTGHAHIAMPSNESVEIQLLQTSQMQAQMLAQIEADIHGLQAQAQQDNTKFCYYDGKPFSEGAKREGRVCESSGIRLTGADGRENALPLRWETRGQK